MMVTLVIVPMLFSTTIVAEREAQAQRDALARDLIRERILRIADDLRTAGTILANGRETAHAVEASDVRVLVSWGSLFHSRSISRIIFTDLDGVVLSRSDDEYHFSDSLADVEPVASVLSGRHVRGFYLLDGEVFLADAQPVLRYSEIPVGIVITALRVDDALLEAIAEDSGVVARVTFGDAAFGFGPTEFDGDERRPVELPFENAGIAPSGFDIASVENDKIGELVGLQVRVLGVVAIVLVVVSAVISWLLHAYLRPYGELVSELRDLAEDRIELSVAQSRFATKFPDAGHEVSIIADAVGRLATSVSEHITLLEELSTTDQLTGLYNRRFMDAALREESSRAVRNDEPFALLLIDIDHFKLINDTFGHEIGDQVLVRLASTLRNACRSTDRVGRWGGEEFMVVSPRIEAPAVPVLGEKLRSLAESADLPIQRSTLSPGDEPVGTISVGAAVSAPGEGVADLVRRADEALYEAKRTGRNRVCLG